MKNQNLVNPYVKYYEDQAGGGGINVFRGASFQRGHGIGSFLGGLFRTVLPLFKSGARAIGKQALSTGVDLLGDVVDKKPFKQAFKTRMSEAGENLKRKVGAKVQQMAGSGLKRVKRLRARHSASKLRRKKTSTLRNRKKKPARKRTNQRGRKVVTDIFS